MWVDLRILQRERIFIHKKEAFMCIESGGAGAVAGCDDQRYLKSFNSLRASKCSHSGKQTRHSMRYRLNFLIFVLLRHVHCESRSALTEKYFRARRVKDFISWKSHASCRSKAHSWPLQIVLISNVCSNVLMTIVVRIMKYICIHVTLLGEEERDPCAKK